MYKLPSYPLNFYVTYILQLENDCWYVGRTKNGKVNERINNHLNQCATAGWCFVHKPIKVHRVLKGDRETEVTKKMIDKYGEDKVRGGVFVKVHNPSWDHKHTNFNIHGCQTL